MKYKLRGPQQHYNSWGPKSRKNVGYHGWPTDKILGFERRKIFTFFWNIFKYICSEFPLFVKTIFTSFFLFTRVFFNIEKIIPEYSCEHASRSLHTLTYISSCSRLFPIVNLRYFFTHFKVEKIPHCQHLWLVKVKATLTIFSVYLFLQFFDNGAHINCVIIFKFK